MQQTRVKTIDNVEIENKKEDLSNINNKNNTSLRVVKNISVQRPHQEVKEIIEKEEIIEEVEQKETKSKKSSRKVNKVVDPNRLSMVLPTVGEYETTVKKSVTASMFLGNRLNIEEIQASIINERVDSANNRIHHPRETVVDNTIILHKNKLKIVNPTKKVIKVTQEDIQKISKREEPKPLKVVKLGGKHTLYKLLCEDEEVKKLIEEEINVQETFRTMPHQEVLVEGKVVKEILEKNPEIKNKKILVEATPINEPIKVVDSTSAPSVVISKKEPEVVIQKKEPEVVKVIEKEVVTSTPITTTTIPTSIPTKKIIVDSNEFTEEEKIRIQEIIDEFQRARTQQGKQQEIRNVEQLIDAVDNNSPIYNQESTRKDFNNKEEILGSKKNDNIEKTVETEYIYVPSNNIIKPQIETAKLEYEQKDNNVVPTPIIVNDDDDRIIYLDRKPTIQEETIVKVIKQEEPEVIVQTQPEVTPVENIIIEKNDTQEEPKQVIEYEFEEENTPIEEFVNQVNIKEEEKPNKKGIEVIDLFEYADPRSSIIDDGSIYDKLNRVVQPVRIIEKEIVEDYYTDEEKEFMDSVNYLDELQPNNVDEIKKRNKPKKLYRRLSEQSIDDKIITNWEMNLPEPGVLIDYPDVDYAIEMNDIYKTFDNGKILANRGINLRVRRNNVHAIIGENGAGKSVLMSILFGIYNADSGTIKVNGEEVLFSSAKDAALKGIGMVHQHFKLVETDTVFENVILGLEDTSTLGFLKNAEARRKVQNIIDRYGFNIDIDKKVADLNVADQQKTEIIKLLYRDADILIFDEPTAVLSELEIKQFLDIVKHLKEEGKTVILITHKFNEIRDVADRATVIRLGTFISEFDMNEKSDQEIITEMVGNNIEFVTSTEQGLYNEQPVFEINNLVIDEKINSNPINLKVHAGEIFAIAGVTGNGQSELALIIAGLLKNKTGEILINGKNISNLSVSARYKDGLAYVPEDRHKYSIILDLPIYLNTVIDKIDNKPYSKSGFMNIPVIKEYTRLFIKKNDVRGTSRGTTPIRNLSGGNQQKLVIARELDRNYDILVLEQPTRGLDVAAINKIHKEILEEKAKGKAILLISYELDEILSIADTVAVMNKYEIVETKNINDISRDEIGKLMVGENG